jgi:hypothetical protein
MNGADDTPIPSPPRRASNLGAYDNPEAHEPERPTRMAELGDIAPATNPKGDWAAVAAALDRCAASSDSTAKAIEDLGKRIDQRFDQFEAKYDAESKALTKMLTARFDDIDTELLDVNRKLSRASGLIAALNQLLTGLRHFGKSMHDRLAKHDDRLREIERKRIRFRNREPRRRRWLHVVSNEG